MIHKTITANKQRLAIVDDQISRKVKNLKEAEKEKQKEFDEYMKKIENLDQIAKKARFTSNIKVQRL